MRTSLGDRHDRHRRSRSPYRPLPAGDQPCPAILLQRVGQRPLGAGGHQPRPAGQRDRGPARPLRLGQVVPAPHHRRALASSSRRAALAGPAGDRTVPGHRHGVPELCALPLADGAGERGDRAGAARRAGGRAALAIGGGDRPDRAGRLRIRLSARAFRRDAPARRLRARPGGPSRAAADGRALLGAGRAHRRDAAHRPGGAVAGEEAAPLLDPAGDPQHRRGGPDVRPHHHLRLQPRPHRPRDHGRPRPSARPQRTGLPPAGGRHLRPHDQPLRPQAEGRAAHARDGRQPGRRHGAGQRVHQPAWRA